MKAEAKKKMQEITICFQQHLFQHIISGHLPEFSEEKPIAITLNSEKVYPMNGEKAWISPEENRQLKDTLRPMNQSEEVRD